MVGGKGGDLRGLGSRQCSKVVHKYKDETENAKDDQKD